jgi:hypothetical protein
VGTPVGLLAKLMAAVRPQFRAEDLLFDPRDPVFGGPPCAVHGCARPQREHGMCFSHRQRWRVSGKPDLAVFVATTTPGWQGHLALESCAIPGCRYGLERFGLCSRHARQWDRAGRPSLPEWRTSPSPLPAPARTPLPAGSVTATCGPRGYPRSAGATTTDGRRSVDPRWRGSSPPTPPRGTVVSTSTCGVCPPNCGWRSPTCCSAAVKSRQPSWFPHGCSRSCMPWQARGCPRCWSRPWT